MTNHRTVFTDEMRMTIASHVPGKGILKLCLKLLTILFLLLHLLSLCFPIMPVISCLILLTRLRLLGQTQHHQQILLKLPDKDCQCFDSFSPISLNEIIKLVGMMKPSKSPVDILPKSLFTKSITSIGPCLVSIINLSLRLGQVPRCFKHAVVQPLLKKSSLDATSFNNYRPISKLPFISKILEKVVAMQLNKFWRLIKFVKNFNLGFVKNI